MGLHLSGGEEEEERGGRGEPGAQGEEAQVFPQEYFHSIKPAKCIFT